MEEIKKIYDLYIDILYKYVIENLLKSTCEYILNKNIYIEYGNNTICVESIYLDCDNNLYIKHYDGIDDELIRFDEIADKEIIKLIEKIV